MNKKQKLVKYLKGLSGVLRELSKEVNKTGIDKESLELMQKIGSALLFKGVSIDYTKINNWEKSKDVKEDIWFTKRTNDGSPNFSLHIAKDSNGWYISVQRGFINDSYIFSKDNIKTEVDAREVARVYMEENN